MTLSNQPIELDAPKVGSAARRAIVLILIGGVLLYGILLVIVTFNGIGEETLFRGYVFGGLRRDAGFSFRQAGFISMVIFAAVHLLLFFGNPFFVGFLGTLIAIASAFPMAYLFERGNNTIWAPVLLHTGTHAIRLVDIAEPHYLTAVGFWLAMQMGMVFLVYAFLGNLLRPRGEMTSSGPMLDRVS